jgi:ribose-phosphate pyrophosphokinase
LFTGGLEILESPLFDQLVISDTVPPFRLPPDLANCRLTILDTSATVAAVLSAEYG